MKKFIALLLAVMMVASLAACGTNDDGGSGSADMAEGVDYSTWTLDELKAELNDGFLRFH